jgi:L-serine dehydratase
MVLSLHEADFDPQEDISSLSRNLTYHHVLPATMRNGESIAETYYSVGGGFVIKEGEEAGTVQTVQLPFPVNDADDLLHWCIKTGLSIHEIVMENETAWRGEEETRNSALNIWRVMKECIYRGCHTPGIWAG